MDGDGWLFPPTKEVVDKIKTLVREGRDWRDIPYPERVIVLALKGGLGKQDE